MSMIESISSFMAGLGQKANNTRSFVSSSIRYSDNTRNKPGKYHINPRIRAYGKARLDVTKRAEDELDWQALWREPFYAFPFTWEGTYRHCIEYKVDDYPAEVGFFIDFLGFQVIGFSPSFAQFSTPEGDFTFAVSAIREGQDSTDPDSLRFQFMIQYVEDTITELEQRGIEVERLRRPVQDGSALLFAYLRTPHGVRIDLWGLAEIEEDEEEVSMQRILDQLNNENQESQGEISSLKVDEVIENVSDTRKEVEKAVDEYGDEDTPDMEFEGETEPDNNIDRYKHPTPRSTNPSPRPGAYPTLPLDNGNSIITPSRTDQTYNIRRKNGGNGEMQYLPLEDGDPPDADE